MVASGNPKPDNRHVPVASRGKSRTIDFRVVWLPVGMMRNMISMVDIVTILVKIAVAVSIP